MRNGIYRAQFQVDQRTENGVIIVKDDALKGFDERYFYAVEPTEPSGEYSVHMAPKRRGRTVRHGALTFGGSSQGFQILIRDAQEEGDRFTFYGEQGGDPSLKITIRGVWIHDFP